MGMVATPTLRRTRHNHTRMIATSTDRSRTRRDTRHLNRSIAIRVRTVPKLPRTVVTPTLPGPTRRDPTRVRHTRRDLRKVHSRQRRTHRDHRKTHPSNQHDHQAQNTSTNNKATHTEFLKSNERKAVGDNYHTTERAKGNGATVQGITPKINHKDQPTTAAAIRHRHFVRAPTVVRAAWSGG